MSLRFAFSLSSSFALALVSVSAFGGPVVPAEMTASAQMQVESGMLDGCGLRVVAVAKDQSTTVTAIDFSFNFYRSGTSLLKAGVRVAAMSDRKAMQASQVRQISNFWVRVVGKPAATPNKVGIIKSDSPKGYLFYGASSEDVAPLFGAALGGQPLQVGVRFAGEDIDRIYSGIVKDTGEDFAEVSRCIDELIAAMSKDVETVPAKGK